MDVSPGRGPTEARVLGWSAARPVVEDTPSSTTAAGVAEEELEVAVLEHP